MSIRMTHVGAGLLLLGASTALAQYAITSQTIDGGGGALTGSTYALNGTVGQPDASAEMTGTTYALTGGFWPGAVPPPGCPGDVDGDGDTSLADFAALGTNFGTPSGASRADGDLTGDGAVTLADFAILANDFGCFTP